MHGLLINDTFIPLPANSTSGIERYSSLWQDGIASGEFTQSFELPLTPELRKACQNLPSEKIVNTLVEYDVTVKDAGISRCKGKLKFIGRKDNIMKCVLKVGLSTVTNILKTNYLDEDAMVGLVTLNGTSAFRFVTFTLNDPPSGGPANTGTFGIAVNGTFTSVPFNTNRATTIADFVAAYNPAFSLINGNTATAIGNTIKFTANQSGAGWPFDFSDSILDAELPENGFTFCTITKTDEWDAVQYAQDNAAGAYLENSTGDKICFPVVFNPKFDIDSDGNPNGDYGGYLNYRASGSNEFEINNGTTTFWKYHLVPFVYVKFVITSIFSGYDVGGDFVSDSEASKLLIYNIRSLDDMCPIGDGSTSFNVFKNIVTIKNHLPHITYEQFLNSLRLRFNLYTIVDAERKRFEIGFGEAILAQTASIDLTDLLEDTHEFDEPTNTGLTFKLAQDSNDDLYKDLVKEIPDGTYSVTLVSELPALAANGTKMFVAQMNQYWTFRVATWGIYSEVMNDYIVGDGGKVIDCGLGTLFSFYGPDQLDAGRSWIVPYARQVGITSHPGAEEPSGDYTLRILFYRGEQTDSLMNNYFLAQSYAYTYNGTTNSFARAMHWNTGLGGFQMDYLHRNLMEYGRVVYKDAILPLWRQLAYDERTWILDHGRRYLVRRATFPLPFNQRVKLELLQRSY